MRAGTLAVPGGYPEKWALEHGVPFPPGSAPAAEPVPPSPAAASPDSAEATVEARVLPPGGTAPGGAPEERGGGGCSQRSGDSERTIADGDGGAESRAGASPRCAGLPGGGFCCLLVDIVDEARVLLFAVPRILLLCSAVSFCDLFPGSPYGMVTAGASVRGRVLCGNAKVL